MTTELQRRIEQIKRGGLPDGYKRTKAGIIPTEWDCKALQALCDINPKRNGGTRSQVTFIGMSDTDENGRIIAQHIVPYDSVCKGYTPFLRSDILVAKITPCFENGKGAYAENLETESGFGSTEFHVLRCRPVISGKYLFFHTQSGQFRNALQTEMTGSAGQKRVQTASIASYCIPLPPLEEQRNIAAVLSAQDSVIELQERLVTEKQRQKNYLMQRLLTGKQRLPGFSGEWKLLQARTVFRSVTDKNHNGDLEVLSATQDRGIIPRSQVDIDIKYDNSALPTYKKVKRGDFVISLRSFQGGIEYSAYEGLVSPAYTVLENKIPIDCAYYKQYFKSSRYIAQLQIGVYGIRDGKQIAYDDFGFIEICYPPLDEQKAIGDVLSAADREIELLQRKLEEEKRKKKALSQLLLTGIARTKKGRHVT